MKAKVKAATLRARLNDKIEDRMAQETPKRKRRVRVLVSAAEWQKRLAALESMAEREREEFSSRQRLELSLEDQRDQAIGLLAERFGPGEEGWKRAHENGGCHPSTYRLWDKRLVYNPRGESFRMTAIATGIEYGFFDPQHYHPPGSKGFIKRGRK